MTKQHFIDTLFTMQDLFAMFPETDTYSRDQVIGMLTAISTNAAKIKTEEDGKRMAQGRGQMEY